MSYSFKVDYLTKFNIPKPPLPYVIGRELWIRSHKPPTPKKVSCLMTPATREEREKVHLLDRCFLHPPQPGLVGTQSVLLRLVGKVRAGDGHNAQLLTVKVIQIKPEQSGCPPGNMTLVAKFYDPLYFDHTQDDSDPFICADQDYSHEAEAYQILKSLHGTAIPKYYGSFTCNLPTSNGNQRPVRLILLEHILGSCLRDLKPANFTQAQRQEIFKQIVEKESNIYACNIIHRDLHPRNVMVSANTGSLSSIHVYLIDFGKVSLCRGHPDASLEERQKLFPGIPISPLLRWHAKIWKGTQFEFGPWIDWEWQPWLERTFSGYAEITPAMRKIWLPDFILNLPD